MSDTLLLLSPIECIHNFSVDSKCTPSRFSFLFAGGCCFWKKSRGHCVQRDKEPLMRSLRIPSVRARRVVGMNVLVVQGLHTLYHSTTCPWIKEISAGRLILLPTTEQRHANDISHE